MSQYTRFIRDVLKFAREHGFEDGGFSGSGHFILRHTETGRTLRCSASPSDRWGAIRNARKDILKAAKGER